MSHDELIFDIQNNFDPTIEIEHTRMCEVKMKGDYILRIWLNSWEKDVVDDWELVDEHGNSVLSQLTWDGQEEHNAKVQAVNDFVFKVVESEGVV